MSENENRVEQGQEPQTQADPTQAQPYPQSQPTQPQVTEEEYRDMVLKAAKGDPQIMRRLQDEFSPNPGNQSGMIEGTSIPKPPHFDYMSSSEQQSYIISHMEKSLTSKFNEQLSKSVAPVYVSQLASLASSGLTDAEKGNVMKAIDVLAPNKSVLPDMLENPQARDRAVKMVRTYAKGLTYETTATKATDSAPTDAKPVEATEGEAKYIQEYEKIFGRKPSDAVMAARRKRLESEDAR